MGELILWLLIVAVLAVAWIEWIPQRFAIFPQILVALSLIPAGLQWLPAWYGWATSLLGIATIIWLYFSPKRRKEWPGLFAFPVVVARRFFGCLKTVFATSATSIRSWSKARRSDGEEAPSSNATSARASDAPEGTGQTVRVGFGAAALLTLSPLTAIPWMLLTVLVLLAGEALSGSLPASADSVGGTAKHVVGSTFVLVIVAIDVMSRYVFLSLPVLVAVACFISRWMMRARPLTRRFIAGAFCCGALYPIVIFLADIFDAFDGPLYN